MKEFRIQLKKAMDKRNITQSQLCEKTGIPKSAMSQYLSGAFRPKQERTYLIAQALQTTPEFLMGFTDRIESPKGSLGIVEGLQNSSQSISKNMLLLRNSKNMSQEELADCSGLAVEVIQKYEKGNDSPDPDELLTIADALHTSVAALTGIAIPYYELSEEGRAFFYHNAPTAEEMGMGFPSQTDEIVNKIFYRVNGMTKEQKEKAWEILKTVFGEEGEEHNP